MQLQSNWASLILTIWPSQPNHTWPEPEEFPIAIHTRLWLATFIGDRGLKHYWGPLLKVIFLFNVVFLFDIIFLFYIIFLFEVICIFVAAFSFVVVFICEAIFIFGVTFISRWFSFLRWSSFLVVLKLSLPSNGHCVQWGKTQIIRSKYRLNKTSQSLPWASSLLLLLLLHCWHSFIVYAVNIVFNCGQYKLIWHSFTVLVNSWRLPHAKSFSCKTQLHLKLSWGFDKIHKTPFQHNFKKIIKIIFKI